MPDGRLVTGDKAVTVEVEGLLGLNREQFSQIAMLAQGSFSRLLSGRTEDRGVIFREIFKTKPYQLFQEKLKDRARGLYGRYADSRKSMEQYAGGVITEGHSEELKLRWKEVPQGSLEALLEVLDQLITADEAQQQEKDKVMALVRDEIAALGMELGKMQGDAEVCRDMAAAADVLRENTPVLEQARARYEREKERQADRDSLIGEVTRMEENLKTYDRFDALQENLKACRKETESLGDRLERAALEEERRLFYVGATRARRQLVLLTCDNRFGEPSPPAPSWGSFWARRSGRPRGPGLRARPRRSLTPPRWRRGRRTTCPARRWCTGPSGPAWW